MSSFESEEKLNSAFDATFSRTIGGALPIVHPNVRPGHEVEDLEMIINENRRITPTWLKIAAATATVLPLLSSPFSTHLIEKDEFGFSMYSGQVEFLKPGWHTLLHPLNHFQGKYKATEASITVGTVTIVRVPQSCIGLAWHGSNPQLLLPGMHVNNDASFVFKSIIDANEEDHTFGPIKFVTVRSGSVRVCFDKGVVSTLEQGRFCINSPTFVVGPTVSIQQKNIQFSKHRVLLDGGITLEIEGLLTFQMVNVELMMLKIGSEAKDKHPLSTLIRIIEDVIKGELARTFASLHLEQISQGAELKQDSMLGDKPKLATKEGETRDYICDTIVRNVRPLAEKWGVEIIKFQLESTRLADNNFANEYEKASLAMSKAKANLRALTAENEIKIRTTQAAANTLKIEAEGKKIATLIEAETFKESTIIRAQAVAEKYRIEAKGRNEAGEALRDEFTKKLMMKELEVNMLSGLKANHLTLLGSNQISTLLSCPKSSETGNSVILQQ